MTPDELAASRQLSITEKVIGGVILALLGWVAITTQSTSTRVAVIESRLTDMSLDRYTSDHAAKDKQILEEKITALTLRVETLERVRGP